MQENDNGCFFLNTVYNSLLRVTPLSWSKLAVAFLKLICH